MSKYLKPRTLYLAALGLAAMVTVDMVRRVRSRDIDVSEKVSDTVGAVSQRVSSTAGAVTARAERMVEAVRPSRTSAEDVDVEIEMEMVELDREEQLPVEVGSEADVAAAIDTVEEAVAEAATGAATHDLTEIKGIGPTYARRLQAVGITTYADVAKADAEYLREVTRATGAQADPEEWIAQAKTMS